MSQIINDNELQIIRIERDKQFFTQKFLRAKTFA